MYSRISPSVLILQLETVAMHLGTGALHRAAQLHLITTRHLMCCLLLLVQAVGLQTPLSSSRLCLLHH